MTIKNGDKLAFPVEFSGFNQFAPEMHCGLSKREMFAMHMMAASRIGRNYSAWSDAARDAIDMADALLSELERTK